MIPAPHSMMGTRAAASSPADHSEPFDTRPSSDATDRLATQPLDVVAAASEARFDDPRNELERTVLLAVMLDAARDLERTLNAWLRQTLSEYRGSRSACDLRGKSVEFRLALARFEVTVESTAAQLYRLGRDAADKPATGQEMTASAATARSAIREHSHAAVSSRLTV
jgi:hypothetical protein